MSPGSWDQGCAEWEVETLQLSSTLARSNGASETVSSPPRWGLDSGRKTSGSSPLGSASARQAARTPLCTFSDVLVGSDLGSPGLDHGKCLASDQVRVLRPWSLQGPEANLTRWALSTGGRGAGRLRSTAVCLYKEPCVCVCGGH